MAMNVIGRRLRLWCEKTKKIDLVPNKNNSNKNTHVGINGTKNMTQVLILYLHSFSQIIKIEPRAKKKNESLFLLWTKLFS